MAIKVTVGKRWGYDAGRWRGRTRSCVQVAAQEVQRTSQQSTSARREEVWGEGRTVKEGEAQGTPQPQAGREGVARQNDGRSATRGLLLGSSCGVQQRATNHFSSIPRKST